MAPLLQALDADRSAGGDATEKLHLILAQAACRGLSGASERNAMDGLRAAALLAAIVHDRRARTVAEWEEAWLRRQLADGPRSAGAISTEWHRAGGTRRELRSLRKRMNVVSERDEATGQWRWRLPDARSEGRMNA